MPLARLVHARSCHTGNSCNQYDRRRYTSYCSGGHLANTPSPLEGETWWAAPELRVIRHAPAPRVLHSAAGLPQHAPSRVATTAPGPRAWFGFGLLLIRTPVLVPGLLVAVLRHVRDSPYFAPAGVA